MNKKLVDNLVEDLKPVKVLRPPYIRFAFWLILFFVFVSFGMHSRQEFRQPLLEALTTISVHSLSLWFGLIAIILIGLTTFRSIVPGLKTSIWLRRSGPVFLGLSFLFSILEIFYPLQATTASGARMHCNLEVFLYGIAGSLFCFFFLKQGMFRVSKQNVFYLSLCGGLIPAIVMQAACMYDPMHGVIFHHIMPISMIAGLNALLIYKFKN